MTYAVHSWTLRRSERWSINCCWLEVSVVLIRPFGTMLKAQHCPCNEFLIITNCALWYELWIHFLLWFNDFANLGVYRFYDYITLLYGKEKYIIISMKWRLPSLSELTLYQISFELSHLGSETFKYTKFIKRYRIISKINHKLINQTYAVKLDNKIHEKSLHMEVCKAEWCYRQNYWCVWAFDRFSPKYFGCYITLPYRHPYTLIFFLFNKVDDNLTNHQ